MPQVSTWFPQELLRGVDDAASLSGWTRSSLVRHALERYLAESDPYGERTTERGFGDDLNWSRVRRCLEAVHCPLGCCPQEGVAPDACPHEVCPTGHCPVEICPW